MRKPWPADFHPVFIHAAWDDNSNGPCLVEHSRYWPAKQKRDLQAALNVCDSLVREEILEPLYDCCFSGSEPPIVTAPAMTIHESQNVLAVGYAQWLGSAMGWEVDRDIFQAKTMSKDFLTNPWFRLAHESEFYGTVKPGRRYVIADDVCTMGGTIASLRGFIENQGGSVICATVLASRDGRNFPISLAEQTKARLTIHHNGALAPGILAELGYEISCLTEAEGRFLLRCPSYDSFREGLNGARNS